MSFRSTLFISKQGASLHKMGGRFLVKDPTGRTIRDIPAIKVRDVVLMGAVQVTPAVWRFLAQQDIDAVNLTQDGVFVGYLNPLSLERASTRRLQYQRGMESDWNHALATTIVAGKVQNQKVLLMKSHRRDKKENPVLTSSIRKLGLLGPSLAQPRPTESLLGIEGSASRFYFEALPHLLKQDLGFTRRVRRPPRDPINALLSFGYTLLSGWILSAVRRAGLDPYLGHLHADKDGRPSLVLDLMEEFRPAIVDTTVIRLVNRFDVTGRNFVTAENGAVRMDDIALGRFVKALRMTIKRETRHTASGEKDTWEGIFLRQARLYRLALQKGVTAYETQRTR